MTATDECTCGCGGHDERLAPAPLHNPPGRTALDYRVGEYGSFLAALLDRLASPAYPALEGLTVRTPDDPAIGLLDAAAVLGDLLTFHSERIADEAYVRTANEHRSLVLLGRLVGHRPRPGVAAATHLAYTLERDPRAETLPVVIPRGARAHSVPASADEESLTFETSRDLSARWDFNELKVRRRRPSLVTPDDLERRPELFVEGTANSLQTGDQLLFVFGEQAGGERKLLPVAGVRVYRDEDVTALTLPKSAPPTLKELVDEVRRWTAEPSAPGEPGDEPPTPEVPNPRPVSRLIEDFEEQVLAPLRAALDGVKTPESLAAVLAEPVARLGEAQVLAEPWEEVSAWFEQLQAVLAELADRALELAPAQGAEGGAEKGFRVSAAPLGLVAPTRRKPQVQHSPAPLKGDPRTAAFHALAAVLPALRAQATPSPTGPGAQLPGTDTARLLRALNPGLGSLYPAWRKAGPRHPATPPLPARHARHRRTLRFHRPAQARSGRPGAGHPECRLAAHGGCADRDADRLRHRGQGAGPGGVPVCRGEQLRSAGRDAAARSAGQLRARSRARRPLQRLRPGARRQHPPARRSPRAHPDGVPAG